MQITLLGDVAVSTGASLGNRHEIRSAQAAIVFAMLTLAGERGVTSDALADELWPRRLPASWMSALRTIVSRVRVFVRQVAGPNGELLPALGGRYVLRLPPDARVDALVAESLLSEAREALAEGDPRRASAGAAEAVRLVRGPFFPAHDGQWVTTRRAHHDELLVDGLELTGQAALALGDTAAAVRAATEAVALAPLRESAHRGLMRAHAEAGNRAEAVRAYERLRDLLAEEVGVDPTPETYDAYVRLLGPPAGAGPLAPLPRHDLPRPSTPFIGRGAARSTVAAALRRSRLVTLRGPGGCGKTRLALAAAEDVRATFPGGTWFADLAPLVDPALVERTVAASFGPETDRVQSVEDLAPTLGDGDALVVVDNCEHLADAVAPVIDRLLAQCPSVRVLATSREELRLPGELVQPVAALSLPAPSAGGDPDRLRESEAVTLFLDRGRAALDGFAPAGVELDAVADVCRRLDGLPLAIELAAALVDTLSPAEIAGRLDDRFQLLESRRRGVPPRQRTLSATLDWSFDLLGDAERELLLHLSIFVGSFTIDAVEAVTGDDPVAVARRLRTLVGASVLTFEPDGDRGARYRLLETVRRYARHRLDRAGLADEAGRRHLRHYVAFAAEAERQVRGPTATDWLVEVARELPNLRAAITWAFTHDDLVAGLRMAGGLPRFFGRMGLVEDLARWVDHGLRRDLAPDLRLRALTAADAVAFLQGDFRGARARGEEAVAIARGVDGGGQLADALIGLGTTAVYQNDLDLADRLLAEGAQLCSRRGDRWGQAWALTIRATGSRRAGALAEARDQVQASLTIFRDLDDHHGQVRPLVGLASVLQDAGRTGDAAAPAREATRLALGLADRHLLHISACTLGRIEQALGRRTEARELLLRSLCDVPRMHHNEVVVAVALEGLSGLAAELGEPDAATALLGHAAETRVRAGTSPSPGRRRDIDLRRAELAGALGDETFHDQLAHGRTMGLSDAVRLAQAATGALQATTVTPTAQLLGPDGRCCTGGERGLGRISC